MGSLRVMTFRGGGAVVGPAKTVAYSRLGPSCMAAAFQILTFLTASGLVWMGKGTGD